VGHQRRRRDGGGRRLLAIGHGAQRHLQAARQLALPGPQRLADLVHRGAQLYIQRARVVGDVQPGAGQQAADGHDGRQHVEAAALTRGAQVVVMAGHAELMQVRVPALGVQ